MIWVWLWSNAIAAVHAGARQVEGAMNGIGERAGNCSLEEVIMAIKVRKDIMNVHTRINHNEIWRTSQTVSQICNMPIPARTRRLSGLARSPHSSGIHQDGVLKNRENYEIMTPESIGLNQVPVEPDLAFRPCGGKNTVWKRWVIRTAITTWISCTTHS